MAHPSLFREATISRISLLRTTLKKALVALRAAFGEETGATAAVFLRQNGKVIWSAL